MSSCIFKCRTEKLLHVQAQWFMCVCCCVRVFFFSCLASESRSVKAIKCSWCSERWTEEDSCPSVPYFMVRVHYVEHSEGIHHSAMGNLSFWSWRNNIWCVAWVLECVCVCQGVCMKKNISMCVYSCKCTRVRCHFHNCVLYWCNCWDLGKI